MSFSYPCRAFRRAFFMHHRANAIKSFYNKANWNIHDIVKPHSLLDRSQKISSLMTCHTSKFFLYKLLLLQTINFHFLKALKAFHFKHVRRKIAAKWNSIFILQPWSSNVPCIPSQDCGPKKIGSYYEVNSKCLFRKTNPRRAETPLRDLLHDCLFTGSTAHEWLATSGRVRERRCHPTPSSPDDEPARSAMLCFFGNVNRTFELSQSCDGIWGWQKMKKFKWNP